MDSASLSELHSPSAKCEALQQLTKSRTARALTNDYAGFFLDRQRLIRNPSGMDGGQIHVMGARRENEPWLQQSTYKQGMSAENLGQMPAQTYLSASISSVFSQSIAW